jgi:hypothetical protein
VSQSTELVSERSLRLEPLNLAKYRNPKSLTHGLFRFPGRFHPPLIAYLISSNPGAGAIADPMTGSGTAAVETVAAGRTGIFSDIDPLACLLTRAKTHPVDPEWLTQTFDSIAKKAMPRSNPVRRPQARVAIQHMEKSTSFRVPPDIFHWFQPYVVKGLCDSLVEAANYLSNPRRSDAVLAIFAAIIRRVSRADPWTSSGLEVTKVRKKALQNGLKFDVAAELKRKTAILAKGYREVRDVPRMGTAKVFQQDVRNWSQLCQKTGIWPDLILTSPCYMSAIEYWRRHKLEYCLLGLVEPRILSTLKGEFLGMGREEPSLEGLPAIVKSMHSKLKSVGRQADASSLTKYFQDSQEWLLETRRVLERSNGTAYVVAGGNTNHGLVLDTPGALLRIARDVGLSTSVFWQYSIKNSYMQYPTNGDRIKTETVLKLTAAQ